SAPVSPDLVLIGGGHSHLFVLKHFAMNPVPGVRLTLVTRDLHTPYSGMLPGFIAGHYGYDEAHIDLRPLANYANARLVRAEVGAIDAELKLIEFEDRPALAYDVLSINIGSRPATPSFEYVDEDQFAVKPIDQFLDHWARLEARLSNVRSPFKLAIVGGGAGGVELALSAQYRLGQVLSSQGIGKELLNLSLLTDSETLLPSHNALVRRKFERILNARGFQVYYQARVNRFENRVLECENGQSVESDAVVWVTHAAAPAWLTHTGLRLDENGFIAVNDRLQSLLHPEVFAAGDIASVDQYPRPKSGVFAVRQGIPLALNLARHLRGKPLRSFRPQQQFLSLISTGGRYAIASRGRWALEGAWLWRLKDWIDRRFMRQFSDLPEMNGDHQTVESTVEPGRVVEIPAMRCGGCGSKIGSKTLNRVLTRLAASPREGLITGLDAPDDAAVIELPPGQRLVQSVDYFRAFIDDPYLFGRIAANHALGDIFAMGATPHSAMAIVSIPFASETKQEQELLALMSGIVECLNQNNTALAGGHSTEAGEMGCGLAVNGFASPGQLLFKSGMRVGDTLVLCKPVGTGVLFAADMRSKAKGRWIDKALQQMLISSQNAARCLQKHAATACTDVTGFGLLGHLHEMTKASSVAVEIDPMRVPFMSGALEIASGGILSSLQPQNLRIRHAVADPEQLADTPQFQLLFDPQTAGGLLASLPAEKANACVEDLRSKGYPEAVVIGRVVESFDSEQNMRLLKLDI
ncbi:MAG: selenide, water dikinase SelD, partial [Gammaproteobacteria bacterium]